MFLRRRGYVLRCGGMASLCHLPLNTCGTARSDDTPISHTSPPLHLFTSPAFSPVSPLEEAGLADSRVPRTDRKVNLWLSTPNATARMHFDASANLFVQVRGRKRFVLVDPIHWDALRLHPQLHPANRQSRVVGSGSGGGGGRGDRSGYSSDDRGEVNRARRDGVEPLSGNGDGESEYERVVDPDRTRGTYVVELGPGDVLYIPPFHFHEVTVLGGSSGDGDSAKRGGGTGHDEEHDFSCSVNVYLQHGDPEAAKRIYSMAVPLPLHLDAHARRRGAQFFLLRLFHHTFLNGTTAPHINTEEAVRAKPDSTSSLLDSLPRFRAFLLRLFESRWTFTAAELDGGDPLLPYWPERLMQEEPDLNVKELQRRRRGGSGVQGEGGNGDGDRGNRGHQHEYCRHEYEGGEEGEGEGEGNQDEDWDGNGGGDGHMSYGVNGNGDNTEEVEEVEEVDLVALEEAAAGVGMVLRGIRQRGVRELVRLN